jgi:streptogramin lyase
VNPSTLSVEATVDISGAPRDVAVAAGNVWVATDSTTGGKPSLLRFDPADQKLLGTTEVGDDNDAVSEIAVGSNGLYVLIENQFGVARLSPTTGAVEKTALLGAAGGYGYGEISVAGEAVWVVDSYSDKIMRLNPTTLDEEIGAAISADLDGDMSAGSDKVFVTSLDGEKAVAFDTATGKSVLEIPLGGRPNARASLVTKSGLLLIGLNDKEGGDLLMFDAKSGGEKGRVVGAFADDLVAE